MSDEYKDKARELLHNLDCVGDIFMGPDIDRVANALRLSAIKNQDIVDARIRLLRSAIAKFFDKWAQDILEEDNELAKQSPDISINEAIRLLLLHGPFLAQTLKVNALSMPEYLMDGRRMAESAQEIEKWLEGALRSEKIVHEIEEEHPKPWTAHGRNLIDANGVFVVTCADEDDAYRRCETVNKKK